MIDPRFVYLAAALSVYGVWGYARDTLRGDTAPNRVTWGLWGIEGVLAFIVEVQEHVGLPAFMTLMFGLLPCVVFAVSFRNPQSVWRIGPFDIVCGAVSVLGIVCWALINEPTVALCAFVAADLMAGVPTLRKSWIAPSSESSRAFVMGVINSAIAIMTLRHFTTAGVLFPGYVLVTDAVIATLVLSSAGPRWRHEASERRSERV